VSRRGTRLRAGSRGCKRRNLKRPVLFARANQLVAVEEYRPSAVAVSRRSSAAGKRIAFFGEFGSWPEPIEACAVHQIAASTSR